MPKELLTKPSPKVLKDLMDRFCPDQFGLNVDYCGDTEISCTQCWERAIKDLPDE